MAGSRSAPGPHLGKQRARRNHGLEKGCHHNENEPQTQNSKKTPTAPFPIQISTLNVDKALQEAGKPSQPDLVQSSEPQTSRIRGHRDRSFPISVAAVTPNPPEAAPGAGNAARGWATVGAASPPPPPPARGLSGGWRAPPPRAGSGARAPGPPRRLLPGAPAAVPETPARGRHPDFGAPGLPAASQACLGPGPGARTAPGKALTLHRAREALAFVARVHGRRLGARGWSPAGRGARARGARVYMVQGLFLLFFPPTPPAFLLPTPRGGEDGCTASATSAA